MRSPFLAAATLLGCLGPLHGQTALANRILGVKDGTVRLTYAVREGICGDGETFIRDRTRGDGENNFISFDDGASRYRGGAWSWRNRPCEPGPARVSIAKDGGLVTKVRVYVGGGWGRADSGTIDLGAVAAPAAAHALIELAAQDRRAERALFAALLADSAVVWPDLLALAKNDAVAKDTRRSAVFWLSQVAGDAATKGLSELAEDDTEDREIRDQAVFALSQLPAREGIPILIRLARSNRDPKVRRKALFWLGQSDDPRALKLFEEILTGR